MSFECSPGKNHPPQEYTFFKPAESRRELFDIAKKLSDYLDERQIATLVLIDTAARPLAAALNAFRGGETSNKVKIFFLDPAQYQFGRAGWPRSELSRADKMEKSLGNYADKKSPLLVVDTCAHTGKTLTPVLESLKRAGFTNVKIGLVTAPEEKSVVKADLLLTDKPSRDYEWDEQFGGTDPMVSSRDWHCDKGYSKRSDEKNMSQGVMLRREIKKIIEEQKNAGP